MKLEKFLLIVSGVVAIGVLIFLQEYSLAVFMFLTQIVSYVASTALDREATPAQGTRPRHLLVLLGLAVVGCVFSREFYQQGMVSESALLDSGRLLTTRYAELTVTLSILATAFLYIGVLLIKKRNLQ